MRQSPESSNWSAESVGGREQHGGAGTDSVGVYGTTPAGTVLSTQGRGWRHVPNDGPGARSLLRLVGIENVDWQDRVHFFAVSAQLMRRILVDAARARATAKRAGPVISLDDVNAAETVPAESRRGADVIALDDALAELAERDPRRARVVGCGSLEA